MNAFDQKLGEHQLKLRRGRVETLQVNVGRKCNQACRHCHVDAGPWRTEMMSEETAQRVADWIQTHRPAVVDITGGAPELSVHFGFLVQIARGAGSRVIDRNNLTILEEPGFQDLPDFLAQHAIEVVASLPCYLPDNVTKQRGAGVYEKSVRGLKKLKRGWLRPRPAVAFGLQSLWARRFPGPQAEIGNGFIARAFPAPNHGN